MTSPSLASNELLSIHAGAGWLKKRGLILGSRHGLYVAIASNRLRVAGVVRRIVYVSLADLEAYAKTLPPPIKRSPRTNT